MKIVTVLGARPQFIKAGVVSHAFAEEPGIREVLVHTGQHFDSNMSDIFFSELGISRPSYQLNVHGGGHGAMTGRMLMEVERVLLDERPDAVLVYGDTNSTLAGALAAAKLKIPVAHVEAGLRSFNMGMPEEINRILTDRVSTWLFTPTESADANLVQEGFANTQIFWVGDVMFDAALYYGQRVKEDGRILAKLGLVGRQYVLATIHRAENTDLPDRLTEIVKALCEVAEEMPVVWPLHPRTRDILKNIDMFDSLSRHVNLIEPVGYLDMVQLEKFASVIATDSGGVQKEAFFYRVPCVTLRDETEWGELINAGWNRLAPPGSSGGLARSIKAAIGSTGELTRPYGDGQAARKIVAQLRSDIDKRA